MRQTGGKHSQCGKMTESAADAANWRKAELMRQNDGKSEKGNGINIRNNG